MLEREMPARELADWILFYTEREQPDAPGIAEMGADAIAAALGADRMVINGSESGTPTNPT